MVREVLWEHLNIKFKREEAQKKRVSKYIYSVKDGVMEGKRRKSSEEEDWLWDSVES